MVNDICENILSNLGRVNEKKNLDGEIIVKLLVVPTKLAYRLYNKNNKDMIITYYVITVFIKMYILQFNLNLNCFSFVSLL